MKKLTFLLSFIILFSCETDNNENQDQQLSELKQISVDIELPNNSNISNSDLTLSSLFTENSNQIIETFDENSMELTFAQTTKGI